MKRLKSLLALIVVLVGLVFVVSCDTTTSTSSGKGGEVSSSTVEEMKYTLSFDTDGGSAVSSVELAEGASVVVPEVPTKSGLTFNMWCSDIDLLEEYTFPGTMPKDNLTLYAKFSVQVSFDTNGGDAIDALLSDAKAIVNYPVPAYGDNIFMGWFTDMELTTPVSILIPDTNTTLYAKWQVLEQGTSIDISNGVSLSGWDGDSVCYVIEEMEDGTKVSSTADKGSWSAVVSPITVNAKENTTVIITFMGTEGVTALFKLQGNGSETISNIESPVVMTGVEQTFIWTVSSENLTETGQQNLITFLNAGSDGFSDGENPDYIKFMSIKLYKTIGMEDTAEEAIYFNTLGGSAVMPIKAVQGTAVSMPDAPTKAGFDFVGWYSDMELTTEFTFDTMPVGPTTAYAKYQENEERELTFMTNGGIATDVEGNEITSMTVTSGSTITFPSISRSGNIFTGWYTDANLETMFTETSITEHTTLYAGWLNTLLELNPATALDASDYEFVNLTEGVYTIDNTDGSIMLTSSTKTGWDCVYTTIDTTDDLSEYMALHVVVTGTAGQKVLFKINDADEYWLTLDSETTEMYYVLKNPIDVTKKQLVFADAGVTWTSETSMTISTFEFLKEEGNTSIMSYDLRGGFMSNEAGQYTIKGDTGITLYVDANVSKTSWSYIKTALPAALADNMVAFHASFTAPEGTEVLFKLNNSVEKKVVVGESGSAEVYWVLPQTVNPEINFIIFVDGAVDYSSDDSIVEATTVKFTALEMLIDGFEATSTMYTETELTWGVGYYKSTNGDTITASNSFLHTQTFTIDTLPIGSIIVLDSSDWKIRMEGWVGELSDSQPNRPFSMAGKFVIVVDEDFYANTQVVDGATIYDIVAFQIYSSGSWFDITEAENCTTTFHIYTPIVTE